MPHKRNPELSERISGIARIIRSNSIAALENIPLWHERDISHSSAERIILPDSSIAIDYILFLSNEIISGMTIDRDKMLENLNQSQGLIFSPRVMLKLIECGMNRNDAYDLVQNLSMRTFESKENFKQICANNEKIKSKINNKDLDEIFDYNYYLRFTKEQFNSIGWKT